jgi:hypothetical protein
MHYSALHPVFLARMLENPSLLVKYCPQGFSLQQNENTTVYNGKLRSSKPQEWHECGIMVSKLSSYKLSMDAPAFNH